jgi:hypothetical protein
MYQRLLYQHPLRGNVVGSHVAGGNPGHEASTVAYELHVGYNEQA